LRSSVSNFQLVAESNGVTIRRMRDHIGDYALLDRWLTAPHVAEWWDTARTELGIDGVIKKYRPRTRPADPVTACIIEVDGEPVGYVQFYPWGAQKREMRQMGFELPVSYWGVDISIGDRDQIDRGIGSTVVSLLFHYLIDDRAAAGLALVVARDNLRAQRAYEKAGLIRISEVLDSDTRDGQRIPSYLMASPPPP
jgi:aminoglycoside 6'-N-acetyltransferase